MSALVSFTQAWVVTNFDEMLDLLRYFGHDDEVNAMRKAPESERARMWREFYAATDPNNMTPENEALNQYFGRIAQANQRFTDEGVPGWRTDRGRGVRQPRARPTRRSRTPRGRRPTGSCAGLHQFPPGALLPGRERLRAPAAAAEQPGGVRADAGAAAAAGKLNGRGGRVLQTMPSSRAQRGTVPTILEPIHVPGPAGKVPRCAGMTGQLEISALSSPMPNHTPPQLFLIDGYALIYRAFFAMIAGRSGPPRAKTPPPPGAW